VYCSLGLDLSELFAKEIVLRSPLGLPKLWLLQPSFSKLAHYSCERGLVLLRSCNLVSLESFILDLVTLGFPRVIIAALGGVDIDS
jgi:hypothetical protein